MKTQRIEFKTGKSPEPCADWLSENMFPGREKLYVHEVAAVIGVSANHLLDLILEGVIKGIVVDASAKLHSQKRWRITPADYDAFIRYNNSVAKRLRVAERAASVSKGAESQSATPANKKRVCKTIPARCNGGASAR